MSPMPVLFLSHGAPPLADDARWTRELARWSTALVYEHGRPRDILMVSAHWEDEPVSVSATRAGVPLVHDFWGFPQKYYEVTYDAPAAPDLAGSVERVLGASGDRVRRDEARGLDHGAYVPLVEMFPEADVPVLQLSLPTLDPQRLVDLGRRLAPLREGGTLIVGSGFTTHNLRWFDPRAGADTRPPAASSEFDHWAAETVSAGDLDTLLDFERAAPAAHEAHPRTEHWAPLYLALGAADGLGSITATTAVEGFWFGLSKRSWQLT
jgi:4,5-DOPA dioxygenase extradiol